MPFSWDNNSPVYGHSYGSVKTIPYWHDNNRTSDYYPCLLTGSTYQGFPRIDCISCTFKKSVCYPIYDSLTETWHCVCMDIVKARAAYNLLPKRSPVQQCHSVTHGAITCQQRGQIRSGLENDLIRQHRAQCLIEAHQLAMDKVCALR